MTEQGIILNRLLDKYESSKHLLDPGTSLRRVMLKVEKKDFPEYIYEDAVIRDAYNEAASELEKKYLVQLEWVKGRPVLSAIVLRLDQISQCYAFAERMHPEGASKSDYSADRRQPEGRCDSLDYSMEGRCLQIGSRATENSCLLQNGRYSIAGPALRFP